MPVIPEDIKLKILATWDKFKLKPSDGWRLRHQAMTDGYWLAKDLLGHTDFTDCHREIFNFFVQKDPDAIDFKSFAEAYEGSKDDMLMLCRGGFKSTADIVDAIQWTITFPDIRINIMTGTVPLAEEFVELYKSHFRLRNKEGDPALGPDGKPKLFQILFPEHCQFKMTEETVWTSPARRRAVAGPTIRATGIETNTTGTHCDVLKADDCTTAENTNTPGRIASVNQAITQARRLVEPYGFKLRIGTPYHPSDNLASTVEDEKKRAKKGRPPLVKILHRPAFTIKPGFEHVAIDDLTNDMVNLWFPERITLQFLKTEYEDSLKSDPKTFYSQYLLSLEGSTAIRFSRDKLSSSCTPYMNLPPLSKGQIFQAWDLAYGQTTGADFSCGITGLFHAGRIYILDFCRGRYDENQLPKVIAAYAFKWHPARIAIEDMLGAKWIRKEIRREMDALRYPGPNIEYFPTIRTTAGSKINRVQPVIRLLLDNRLAFSNETSLLETFIEEASVFPTKSKQHGRDDMVDSLAHLVNYFYVETSIEAALQEADSVLTIKDDMWYNHVHGLDKQGMLTRSLQTIQNGVYSQPDMWDSGISDMLG